MEFKSPFEIPPNEGQKKAIALIQSFGREGATHNWPLAGWMMPSVNSAFLQWEMEGAGAQVFRSN